MKNFSAIVAVLSVWFGMGVWQAEAQNSHDDGGVLVVEDSLLSPNHKSIVFVVAKDINQSVKIELQTYALVEGFIHQFKALEFPQGVRRGQVIPIWDGNFNQFQSTAWLYFQVTMSTAADYYYTEVQLPIGQREEYKEPTIGSISETGGYTEAYKITVKGIFDTTIPSLILINTKLFVNPKTITQTAPGTINFKVPANSFEQFPTGKYLLTICQAGHCDTMIGRHR